MSNRPQAKQVERDTFDRWVAERGWRTLTVESMRRLAETFCGEVRSTARMLDLACGSGEYTEHLVTAAGLGRVWAADLSAGAVRALRQRVPGVHATVADAERLPFPDDSFGGVFLGNVLHHFPAPSRMLRECWRVLEPGGRLFAIDPNPQNPLVFVFRVLLGSRSMKTDNEVLHWPSSLKRELSGSGFEGVVVGSALPLYFERDYYDRVLGPRLGVAVYPGNLLERSVFSVPRVGRQLGAFLVSRGTKRQG
ncbi:MAG: methyltransferase domain-containing protein [Myxococcaceae bacterium]|nr:methyltransferase domain-containing protein [Myxococcaceae bacterium]